MAQMRREDNESDEEAEVGSIAGRSYKPRNRAMMHASLMNNYFNLNLVYIEEDFRRRFQMRSHVFECLLHDVQQVNPYFRQKKNKAGRLDFSPHQKVTVALRMMAYGSPVDSMDETHGMSEFTCLDTIAELCDTIVQLYKDECLREPNQEYLDLLIHKAEDLGFLSTIGSLYCMHWDWKNRPTRWQESMPNPCVIRGNWIPKSYYSSWVFTSIQYPDGR
ncbi:uncharacterized protein [Pyrus communis]|uniref:uncharacterized protein n=1 Tax=Pyrus communis TaxID=23211 RepID=UPI0035C032FE